MNIGRPKRTFEVVPITITIPLPLPITNPQRSRDEPVPIDAVVEPVVRHLR